MKCASLLPLGVASLVLLGSSATGDPPAPPLSRSEVEDGETQYPRRAIHDVERAWVEVGDGRLRCGLRMRRPVLEGTHVSVHFLFDADDNPDTGVEGADLDVRGTLGSYFRRMSDTGADAGLRPASSFASGSYARAVLDERPHRDGTPRREWSWGSSTKLPVLRVVDERELRLEAPSKRLQEAGLRYNATVPWRAIYMGLLADGPITVPVRFKDEGTDIRVDGRTSDWSVTARSTDVVGETHPDVDELDLASLAVDHGPHHVFLLVGMARGGFRSEQSDDVRLDDNVTVALDPAERRGAYMPYTERRIWVRGAPDDTELAVEGPWLEIAIPRRAEQTSLRVFAWSEVRRADLVPDHGSASLTLVPGSIR